MEPTSDERREVAKRLRKTHGIMAFVEELGIDFDSDWCWTDVSRRVADLIDPTCKVSSVETYCDELGQLDGWEFHLACGHSVKRPYYEAPAYCPECGARVVSDDD